MIYRINLNRRAFLAWAHDVVVAGLALLLAYAIRLNFEGEWWQFDSALRLLPWVLPVQGAVFVAVGLYRGLWRYASLRDLRHIALASGLATLVVPLMALMTRIDVVIPRSVLVMLPLLMAFAMGGSRLIYRMWREHRLSIYTREQGDPVIVIGAGDAASKLLRDLEASPLYKAAALLDDDAAKIGRLINGTRVIGRIDQYAEVARQFNTNTAIVAMPGARHEVRRQVVAVLSAAGARILTVPSFEELLAGAANTVRKIELDDLLGRDTVELDQAGLERTYTGQTILITGAGGSIGSELCRQLTRFAPEKLVLFDMSEFALYQLTEEFAARFPSIGVVAVIGDIKDEGRVEHVFRTYRPQVVFHAAAYKHVPLMEGDNAAQALRNNSYGTFVVGKSALRFGAKRFVLVSTDKAVNPTNVMGATKRLAEMLCQHLNEAKHTQFCIVRFGNVLGSSGSVIPKFQEQIAAGGPLTVTHPEVIRFFMSIPEAAQLVLQAGAMGSGGEIFVLDMGAPVKIVDLARDMIRLAGYTEAQIGIRFTGLRPGEKLFEELLASDENTLPTPHPKLRIARSTLALRTDLDEIVSLIAKLHDAPSHEIKTRLAQWVAEYSEYLPPAHNPAAATEANHV